MRRARDLLKSIKREQSRRDTADDLDTRIEKLAIQYSWKAIRQLGIPLCEREDIQQELHFGLWQRLRRFDADRGEPAPFLGKVAKNEVLKIFEHLTAGRRDHRRCVGLDDPASKKVIGTCKDPHRKEDVLILAIDVRRGIKSLAPRLRRIADSLLKASPTDLLRSLKTSKAGFYRVLGSIRVEFEALGLDAHIEVTTRGRKKSLRNRKKQ